MTDLEMFIATYKQFGIEIIPIKTETHYTVILGADDDSPDFTIRRDDSGAFIVEGKNIERLVAMTRFHDEESLRRFQNILRRNGIDEALRNRGIKDGDTVRIREMEFEFSE